MSNIFGFGGGFGGLNSLGSLGGLGGSLGGLLGGSQLVVFSNPRTIGQLAIDCTLQEGATDALEITQHPVEQGANITDHAVVLPCVITFRALWSNSGINGNGDPQYAIDIYNALLQTQQARQPVQVATGKRLINTALIKTLAWANDHTTDQALVMDITIQEIILVSTTSTTLPAASSQQNPASTLGYSNSGNIQAVPTTTDTGQLGDVGLP